MHMQVVLSGLMCLVAVTHESPLAPTMMAHLPIPGHPNQCQDPGNRQFYNVNDTWRLPDTCAKRECGTDRRLMVITTAWCNFGGSGCRPKSPSDPARPYPDCCPRYDC